jgi:asparagine N-glycosylation enzyme membrane subunit Stt3
MNWASLSSNDKLAVYGSVAVIIGGILSFGIGLGWLALLAAIAMLIIVFLPSMSPNTTLPGAKGSLMLICGAIAAIGAVLGLLIALPFIGFYFTYNIVSAIGFLIAIAGGLLMGWAGWQAFQGEGGKFNVGMNRTGTGTGTGMGTGMGGASTTSTTTTTTEQTEMEEPPRA